MNKYINRKKQARKKAYIYSKFLYKSFLVQKSDKVISTQNFHDSFSYENISIKFSYVSASY